MAVGVVFIQIGVNFADGHGVLAEARDGLFPAAAVGLHIAGEHEIGRVGEGGFETVVGIAGLGEDQVDGDGGRMGGGDAFEAVGEGGAHADEAAVFRHSGLVDGEDDGGGLPGRGLFEAEEEIVGVLADLGAEGGPAKGEAGDGGGDDQQSEEEVRATPAAPAEVRFHRVRWAERRLRHWRRKS